MLARPRRSTPTTTSFTVVARFLSLADAAEAVNGKLYILGGGWSITGPDPTPSAIAIKIEVPWDQAKTRHQLKLELFNDDGQPIMVPTPIGEQPEIGRAHV